MSVSFILLKTILSQKAVVYNHRYNGLKGRYDSFISPALLTALQISFTYAVFPVFYMEKSICSDDIKTYHSVFCFTVSVHKEGADDEKDIIQVA